MQPRVNAYVSRQPDAANAVAGINLVTTIWRRSGVCRARLMVLGAALLLGGTCAAHAGTWVGLNDLDVRAVAVDRSAPNTVYVGSPSGVAKTTDGGAHWQTLDLAANIATLAIDPWYPSTIYAGGDGLFKSTDGGSTWSAIGGGSDNLSVGALATWARFCGWWGGWCAGAGGVYAATSSGLLETTDRGVTWKVVNPSFVQQHLIVNPADPAMLYSIAMSWRLRFRLIMSTDGGASWDSTNLAQVSDVMFAWPTIYAATVDGVRASNDGGASWNETGSQLSGMLLYGLAVDPNNQSTLYVMTDGQVFQTTDAAQTWHPVSARPFSGTGLSVAATQPSTVYAATDHGLFALRSVCGDGIVDAGEECDDGNQRDGDGCDATCMSAPLPVRAGDCNGDGSVTVDELVQCVTIAMDNTSPVSCPSLDANSDGTVTVNELVAAVNHALTGGVTVRPIRRPRQPRARRPSQ